MQCQCAQAGQKPGILQAGMPRQNPYQFYHIPNPHNSGTVMMTWPSKSKPEPAAASLRRGPGTKPWWGPGGKTPGLFQVITAF